MKCRHCAAVLEHKFLDLGFAPPSNAYLSEEALHQPEVTYPLRIYVCALCWLVQTEDYTAADALFSSDYAYFSSTSQSWLAHAQRYVTDISEKLRLSPASFVIEVASNDGYLLRNFVQMEIPCLGIEPTESTAEAARALGVPTLSQFFGVETAHSLVKNGQKADLICGNNVYAHVPDINDFTAGLRIALKVGGTINLEFPHLMQLMDKNQFDTIYHEHFSYLSLSVVARIFEKAGLRVFSAEELPTHGGSLRIYGCHVDDPRPTEPIVGHLLKKEQDFGLCDLKIYQGFQAKVDSLKNDFLKFLLEQKSLGKKIAAYGAAAKGNTLINYAGVKTDLIDFVCDASPSKQYKFMPGSHIPILPPSALITHKPDWVLILPWNISEEVMEQQNQVKTWGAQFVRAIPALGVFS